MDSLLAQVKAAARDATETRNTEIERQTRRRNKWPNNRHLRTRDQPDQCPRTPKALMSIWRESKWKEQWLQASQGKQTPVWRTPWRTRVPKLHALLSKSESTVATLLRTEAIGLNDFLHRVGVLGIEERC